MKVLVLLLATLITGCGVKIERDCSYTDPLWRVVSDNIYEYTHPITLGTSAELRRWASGIKKEHPKEAACYVHILDIEDQLIHEQMDADKLRNQTPKPPTGPVKWRGEVTEFQCKAAGDLR